MSTARGLELAMAYYGLLDRTADGPQEEGEQVFWLRRRDEYEDAPLTRRGGGRGARAVSDVRP